MQQSKNALRAINRNKPITTNQNIMSKKAKLEWLNLTGNRSMTISITPETSHLISGAVLQSKNNNQFRIVEHDDVYEVVPATTRVSSDDAYLLIGNLSPEFSQQMIGMKGSEKLALCRSIGIV